MNKTSTIPTQPTAEEINQHFSAMQDSVDLINKLKAKPSLEDGDQDTINRNKEHLVIMLAKDFIANDTRDKSAFIAATE
jgi:hypothetical protein